MKLKVNPFPYRGTIGEFCGKCCQNCRHLDEETYSCSKQIMLWDDLMPMRTKADKQSCPDWETVYEQ